MPDEAERVAPQFLDEYAFRAELDKAIAAEREKMMAELTEQFTALSASLQKPAPTEATGVVSALATQLAELTGQGQGRIYVAPDVIERRRNAFVALEELLVDLHRKSDKGRNIEFVPAYRLTSKVQLNLGRDMGESLIEPIYRERGTNLQRDRELYWQGIPNFAMQPINEPAEQVHALFCQWTGNISVAREPDRLMALTAQGAVVRGSAAAVLLRGQNRRVGGGLGFGEEMPTRPDAPEEGGDDFGFAAVIRETTSDVKKVQVYGRNTKPVEVS